jgi:hypothetical protein
MAPRRATYNEIAPIARRFPLDNTMTQAQTADVIIIGGGVAGLSTAMQLAGRGSVLLHLILLNVFVKTRPRLIFVDADYYCE